MRERILMATAAALVGLLVVLNVVLPILSQLGRGSNWLWAVYAMVLLLVPLALLIPAVIQPRSVLAAVAAALAVGTLLIWGMSAPPMSWPRLQLHLAAILCLAALVIQVIRGIADRRFRVLWILPCLLLSFPIGLLVAALIGFHIVLQYCQLPAIGADASSILCSG